MGTLKIDALNTNFTIQAKEDDEYLQNLLSYYKQMLKQVETGTLLNDNLKISILAGIMLCDELYKEKCKNHSNTDDFNAVSQFELSEAERITVKMIEDIDRILA